MRIKVYKKIFPDTLLPGWYWNMKMKNSYHVSGPYRTLLSALKDVAREMRFLVSIMKGG
jgi:hypothetical protein